MPLTDECFRRLDIDFLVFAERSDLTLQHDRQLTQSWRHSQFMHQIAVIVKREIADRCRWS